MQGDLRFTHTYFNMSDGSEDVRGPWNKGKGPWEKGEQWEYVDDPTAQVTETSGQREKEPVGHERDPKQIAKLEKDLAAQRSAEVTEATPDGELQWSEYANDD
jgi:Mn-containing catalase